MGTTYRASVMEAHFNPTFDGGLWGGLRCLHYLARVGAPLIALHRFICFFISWLFTFTLAVCQQTEAVGRDHETFFFNSGPSVFLLIAKLSVSRRLFVGLSFWAYICPPTKKKKKKHTPSLFLSHTYTPSCAGTNMCPQRLASHQDAAIFRTIHSLSYAMTPHLPSLCSRCWLMASDATIQ
ncbi:hypothetical protein LY78DRAFT_215618 [Colletotrichum sublineola]|nr:hypothetical protein LY78DRAFT_215618 [Colletotrichum sublineola]